MKVYSSRVGMRMETAVVEDWPRGTFFSAWQQISVVTGAARSSSTVVSFVDRCKSCRDAPALLDVDTVVDREGGRQNPCFLEVDAETCSVEHLRNAAAYG